MNYSKLIHEYLDGELKTPFEDALFAGLSANNELRTEFSRQIKLHIVAQNDMGTISAPVESTNQIFSSLGFSIPSASYMNKVGDSARKVPPLLLFFKKHIATVATAIISIILTSFVYTVFLNENSESNNIAKLEYSTAFPVTQSFDPKLYYLNSDNPNSEAQNLEHNNNHSLNTNRISNKNVISNNKLNNKLTHKGAIAKNESANNSNTNSFASDNNKPKQEESIDDYLLALSETSINEDDNFTNNKIAANIFDQSINSSRYDKFNNHFINSSKSNPYIIPISENPLSINTDNTKFSLQMRGFQYSAPTSELKANGNPFFNNMSISAFYKFDRVHSLGLEFGQEQFAQKFINPGSGQAFEYEQNPLIFWYGASYRWTANDLNIANIIYPYSQVFAGLANDAVSGKIVGPLGRVQMGLQLKPINNVTFSFGIEGAMLLYSIHNQLLSSDKLGLTYGISLSY